LLRRRGFAGRHVLFDLVDQDHRIAHDHAEQRNRAEHRHEAEGLAENEQERAIPMMPSGAVSKTMMTREMLCSWIIRTVMTASMKSGMPAMTDFEPLADSSIEPPVAMR
jgi:hypothetical protein